MLEKRNETIETRRDCSGRMAEIMQEEGKEENRGR